MNPRLALGAAVVSGSLVALQQRVNADLGSALHDPFLAALVSFSGGLVLMSLFLVRPAVRGALPLLFDVPVWSRLGGLGGATLVAVGATAAPKIGVALLTVGLVAGTTVAALGIDQVGLGPGGRRALTRPRLAGALLTLVAIALSAREGLRAASVTLLALVVLAGGLVSLQQAVNGRVREVAGVTAATLWNFVVGTSALGLGVLAKALFGALRADHWPSTWWMYAGGPIGTVFIAIAALFVGSLGVLRFGLGVTAGQLIGGVLLDLDRGVSGITLLAVALTLVGVAISGVGAA